ncbi:T9SS type A sorting domain-containing protein, partial [Flavobacteriaceae bacterium KMM 6898]|nr:T9SS type A sorting domain-containing protein [Flavobacteriaceae bacterium KMM 6898]
EVLGSGSGPSSKNGTLTALDLGSSSKTIHTLKHYPNPSSLNTEIAISDPSVIIKDIFIRDISGRLVVQYDAQEMKIGQGIYGFNVDGLEDGIYLVTLMNGSTVVMNYKLIVRK